MDDLALLRLQMEWGADEALDEAPVDRLRRGAGCPSRRLRSAGPDARACVRPTAVAIGTPVERAIRASAQAETLEALKAAIATFEGCPLRDMATNIVFATGDPDAGVLLIGGPPGADEDRSGIPFSGREGALLDQMLGSVGLTREAMLLAPVIPWRPPGGRVPNPGELQLYRPFLLRLIALAAPSRMVLFGDAGGEHGAWRRASRADGWVDRSAGRGADPARADPAGALRPAEDAHSPQRRLGWDAAAAAGAGWVGLTLRIFT